MGNYESRTQHLVHILRAPSEAQMTIFLLLARKVEKEHKNNENSRAK